MAAIVFMTVGPLGFLVGFAVSEVIGYLSTIIAKEATRMGNAIVKCVKERTGKTGESHLPLSGVYPADEPVQVRRKGDFPVGDQSPVVTRASRENVG